MMQEKNRMNTNGWSIDKGDYHRSFKDEKILERKMHRKKIVKYSITILIYFIFVAAVTLFIIL